MKIYLYASEGSDATLTINKNKEEISVKLNPYVFDFLDDIKRKYELIVYSSLNRKYLQPILKYLEKEKKYFAYTFDEEFCLFANVFQGMKYLNSLCGTRSLKEIVVIDTSVKKYPLNSLNVVPIPMNSHSPEIFLPKLGVILEEISKESDVQKAIERYSTKP